MKRQQPEKTLVVNPIMKKLKNCDIIWSQRLVAEDDIHCPAGTPDIVAVVNCRDGRIALLFIECKKPPDLKGKRPTWKDLRFEQKEFFEKMAGKPMTLCAVVNNPDQLWPLIKKCQNL